MKVETERGTFKEVKLMITISTLSELKNLVKSLGPTKGNEVFKIYEKLSDILKKEK